MKKIIYVKPDSEWDLDEFEQLDDTERVHIAKNCNDMVLYDDLYKFQDDFNNELISDKGYIFVI